MSEKDGAEVAPLIEAMADWQDAQRRAELAAELAAVAKVAADAADRMAQTAQETADAARRALEAAQAAAERASAAAEDARAYQQQATGDSDRLLAEAAATQTAEEAAGGRFRERLVERGRAETERP